MKKLIFLMFSLTLAACGGQGIEVGNPAPIKGLIEIQPQNGEHFYRVIFLKNQQVAIRRDDLDTLSLVGRDDNAANFAGTFADQSTMAVDFSVSEASSVTSLSLRVDDAGQASSYQDYLGEPERALAGNYDWVHNDCSGQSQALTLTQNGDSVSLQDFFPGGTLEATLDDEGYLNFETPIEGQAYRCQALLVKTRLSGACIAESEPEELCTFVYRRY